MLYFSVNVRGITGCTDQSLVSSPHYVYEINAIDNFSFTVPPQAEIFNLLKPKVCYVTVYDSVKNDVVFRGRVLTSEKSSADQVSKEIQCEGPLGYLKESFVRGLTIPAGTHIMNAMMPIILDHNKFVDDNELKFVQMINYDESSMLAATDPLLKEDFTFDGESTYEALKALADSIGFEYKVMRVSQNSPYWQLYISAKFGAKMRDPISTGLNLKSLVEKEDSETLITRIFPFGGVGYDEKRLTLSDYGVGSPISFLDSLPEGSTGDTITNQTTGMYANMYVDNTELVSKWGVHSKVIIFEDIVANSPEELPTKRTLLRNRAKEYARHLSDNTRTFEAEAYDLYKLTPEELEELKPHNYYFILDAVGGSYLMARLIKKDMDYENEAESEMTFEYDSSDPLCDLS